MWPLGRDDEVWLFDKRRDALFERWPTKLLDDFLDDDRLGHVH